MTRRPCWPPGCEPCRHLEPTNLPALIACAIAPTLVDNAARLRACVDLYSFPVVDSHHFSLAGFTGALAK